MGLTPSFHAEYFFDESVQHRRYACAHPFAVTSIDSDERRAEIPYGSVDDWLPEMLLASSLDRPVDSGGMLAYWPSRIRIRIARATPD